MSGKLYKMTVCNYEVLLKNEEELDITATKDFTMDRCALSSALNWSLSDVITENLTKLCNITKMCSSPA